MSTSLFLSFSSHRRRETSRSPIPTPERIKQLTGISKVNMPRSLRSSAQPPHRPGLPGFHNLQVAARAAPTAYQSFVDAVNDLVQRWGPAKEYQPGPWRPEKFGDNLKTRLDEYTWTSLPAADRKCVLKMLKSPDAIPNLFSRNFVSLDCSSSVHLLMENIPQPSFERFCSRNLHHDQDNHQESWVKSQVVSIPPVLYGSGSTHIRTRCCR